MFSSGNIRTEPEETSNHRMPVVQDLDQDLDQDLPVISSVLSGNGQSLKKSRSRTRSGSKSWFWDGLDTESTPTDLIQHWSPPHKHPRSCCRGNGDQDKENHDEHFVLARRSRRKKSSGVSWDRLPDELLLRIYFYVSLQDLLKVSAVCKRWHRLALDESLWSSVDLEGTTRLVPALQQVLTTGVRRLRCPRTFGTGDTLHFPGQDLLQIVELDLSGSVVSTSVIEKMVSCCRNLERLSLEGLKLSDDVINSLSRNPNLQQLNLSGCSDFSASSLAQTLRSCTRLNQLNVSWCSFSTDHVKSVVNNVSPDVSGVNISGCRERITLDDVKVLVKRCPKIQTLDLSDSTLLMADSFPVLKQLKFLQHLSLSRCYHVHLAALTDLKSFPSLLLLDVFGLLQDSQLPSLQKEIPGVAVNARPFSAVARPTPAESGRRAAEMWSRRCRLRLVR
ncbi:S-phase kinase-associated protein 2 [Cololabis saira]|uniref:S-phase kinase-associated protein 2 n=1 Tax=Cololabis saira TaxID=129043 RepID=UPI002AD30C2B|nr:S-phase kinase-associated protein 2 [Cololabis saira]